MTEFQETALALLAPSPTNPRKHFAELEGLAESIKAQGVMQPILIRPWPDDNPTPEGRDRRPAYEIVAGERRYRASLLAGLDTIPTLVRPLTTRQVLEAQIVENLQRRDVTELEEAEGYQLMMRDHGYSADELADKVGKSRAYIYARLKLTALCAEARQFYRDGKLDASRFVSGGAFTNTDQRFLFDTGSSTLYYDADGSGAAAAVALAKLETGTVAANDIRLT